jgi:hypothetical protein
LRLQRRIKLGETCLWAKMMAVLCFGRKGEMGAGDIRARKKSLAKSLLQRPGFDIFGAGHGNRVKCKSVWRGADYLPLCGEADRVGVKRRNGAENHPTPPPDALSARTIPFERQEIASIKRLGAFLSQKSSTFAECA